MELQSIVPWGRSLDEYRKIFSLTEKDLSKRILGCGDGPASFNAELTNLGGSIISIDPTYCFNASQFESRIKQVFDEIMPQLEINKDKYIWDNIDSVAALGELRMSAMQTFISDYEQGKREARYIEAALPNLPFNNAEFDLALCSHYLFLYSEQVNLDEHVESLLELCRVAKEVRVYPLLTLSGELSPYLDPVMTKLDSLGHTTKLVDVAYQFQKGATQMLVINTFDDSLA